MKTITHRQFNNILTVCLMILALYILAMPFYPGVSLWVKKRFDNLNGYVYENNIFVPGGNVKSRPDDNRLLIPSLQINEPVKEGKNLHTIDHGGTWRRPATSTPEKGGNTVIIGHRYTYRGNSTFYNLNMLKTGDVVIIYWEGEEYDYKVTDTKVVSPKAGEIEQEGGPERLTLYTCTLWNAKNRLVVTAERIKNE
jgi:LPXTG-site transpeptidase (sortase) family protein